ncbi:MAG: RsmD family RNA methyltransferase [Pirellulaceae bacterium]|nr:RsmD family RNA methyltransferase [Pirellulaceae bacterium]
MKRRRFRPETPSAENPPPEQAADEPREAVGLRIVGGKMRGRTLTYSGDLRTRPMKDRVREAVFNLIGPRVVGSHAVDLFAGTGALGLEAISRGAAGATFIERHHPTTKLIEQNAAKLGIGGQVAVLFADTFFWAREPQLPADRPWLVFCSPPYEFYVSRADDMLALLGRLHAAAPAESVFVVEADERFAFGQLPQPATWDIRTYPPAVVGILAKTAS